MRCQFSGNNSNDENISFDEQIVSMNNTFWFLRLMLHSNEIIDEELVIE
jgi:hypothetical protein